MYTWLQLDYVQLQTMSAHACSNAAVWTDLLTINRGRTCGSCASCASYLIPRPYKRYQPIQPVQESRLRFRANDQVAIYGVSKAHLVLQHSKKLLKCHRVWQMLQLCHSQFKDTLADDMPEDLSVHLHAFDNPVAAIIAYPLNCYAAVFNASLHARMSA